jgi:cytochrome bd-type quinol oxidase subunit 2
VSLTITELADRLKATPLSEAISGSDTLFPLIECVHVLAVVVVVGAIAIVDLRLLGLRARERLAHDLVRQFVPISLAAFVVAFLAGALMFVAKPDVYIANLFFVTKMALLALAGLNMIAFHLVFGRALAGGDAPAHVPLSARISGGLSLGFWIAIITCGRWIGFTT